MTRISPREVPARCLALLRAASYTSEELSTMVGVGHTSTVLQHLRVMHDNGLVYISGVEGKINHQVAVWSYRARADQVDIPLPLHLMRRFFKLTGRQHLHWKMPEFIAPTEPVAVRRHRKKQPESDVPQVPVNSIFALAKSMESTSCES